MPRHFLNFRRSAITKINFRVASLGNIIMLVYLIYLIIFSLPLYLLRLEFFWIPTTVLELMIYALFIMFLLRLLLISDINKLVDIRYQQKRFLIPIILLLSGCTISTIVAPYKLTSLGILKGWFIDPLLFFVVFITVIKTRKHIRNILASFSLSGAMVAVISLTYFLTGDLTFDGRLKAFFLSPNHLAMYLAPALLVTCYLLFASKKLRARALHAMPLLAICFVMTVALYFTFSYGAWVGAISGFMFLLWFFVKNLSPQKKKVLLLYCSIALLLVVIIGVFQLRTEKFQNFLYSSRSSLQSRLMIWKAGLSILKDHPLWGIGLGTFQKYYLDYASYFREPYLEWAVPQPHNLFLAFWLQAGILGLIGFIWIIVFFFKLGFSKLSFNRAPVEAKLQQTLIIAVMIYILVHGLVDTTYWKNDLAMIFWMTIGLMVVLKTTEAKPQ